MNKSFHSILQVAQLGDCKDRKREHTGEDSSAHGQYRIELLQELETEQV